MIALTAYEKAAFPLPAKERVKVRFNTPLVYNAPLRERRGAFFHFSQALRRASCSEVTLGSGFASASRPA